MFRRVKVIFQLPVALLFCRIRGKKTPLVNALLLWEPLRTNRVYGGPRVGSQVKLTPTLPKRREEVLCGLASRCLSFWGLESVLWEEELACRLDRWCILFLLVCRKIFSRMPVNFLPQENIFSPAKKFIFIREKIYFFPQRNLFPPVYKLREFGLSSFFNRIPV